MFPKASRIISSVLILLFLLMTIGTVCSISTETRGALKGAVQDKLMAVAGTTASQINGDTFAGIRPGDEDTAEFIHIRDQLRAVQQAVPDVRFIYTMRKNGDVVEFVVDADYGDEPDAPPIGTAYPKAEPEMIAGFVAPTANHDFTTDEWGTVLSGFSPIRDRNGTVVGIVGVDMDSSVVNAELNYLDTILYLVGVVALIAVATGIVVVERRRAVIERKVEESEQKYRLLFEQAGDSIMIFEAEGEEQGKIIDANPSAAMMDGFEVEEMKTKNIADFDTEESRTLSSDRFNRFMQTGSVRGETVHVRKDGSRFPLEINGALLSLGTKKYVLAIDRDISGRRSADDAIRRVTNKLSLLNAVTFNDIQNAVFTLNGFISLAKSTKDPEKMLQSLDKAEESVKRISRSLNFAKNYQDLGASPPRWQDVNQTFILGISHLDFSPVTRSVSLNNLEIFADSLLERVFFTLANNVLRHATTATRVTIGYTPDGENLVLFFADNGNGIPDPVKERIFERGYGSQKGMELFLVREILGITGITIRENGVYGSGARFEMVIPRGGYRFRQGP
jgi:PAS domain S-box-containing protein